MPLESTCALILSARWDDKNREQHQRFLDEVEHDPATHADIMSWFKTLPLWLELPGLRVVHACWHQRFMDWLAPELTSDRRLPDALLVPATREADDETEKDTLDPSVFKAVEALTKGIEMQLPDGLWYRRQGWPKAVSGPGSVVECQCRDLPPDRATGRRTEESPA